MRRFHEGPQHRHRHWAQYQAGCRWLRCRDSARFPGHRGVLGDPEFGGAADTFIVILDRLVGKRVQFGEYFAQHQPEPEPEPEFEPEPDHEPIALDDAEPVALGEPEPDGEPGSHRRARYPP